MRKLAASAALVPLIAASNVRPAKAACGDFGGLGVLFVAGATEGAVLLTSLIGAAIARTNDEGATYSEPFWWSFLLGTASTFVTSLGVIGNDCEYPGFIPAVGVGSSLLTLVVWDIDDHPETRRGAINFDIAPLDGGAMGVLRVVGF